MSMGEVKKIVVCLTDDEAMSVAQFLKRLGYSEIRSCAVDDDDASKMNWALRHIQSQFNDAGFNPR